MAHERQQERKLDTKHVSVMSREVLAALSVQDKEVVVDATYGQGGHSNLLKKEAKIKLVSLDADPAAGVVNANFGDLGEVAGDLGIREINKALFDLGWNRGQLSAGRGFSFMTDEPLNMSYGPKPRSGFTAAEILNTFTEKAPANILFTSLSSMLWNVMTAMRPPQASSRHAAPTPCSMTPSSSLTAMRSAWKERVAGWMRPRRYAAGTESLMTSTSSSVVLNGASSRRSTTARAMRRA